VEKFTPSLDWGNEVVLSAIWVVKAWAISAAVLLTVLVLVARFTTWGRQFWRVTGGYFQGRQSIPAWALLGLLLLSVMVAVRLDVLISYYSNDQFSALQVAFEGAGAGNDAVRDSGIRGFWFSILTFIVIVVVYIGRILLDLYLMQRFIIRWRVWLTESLTADWLSGRAYYRGRFVDPPIDNPDQRIQQDIDAFTAGTGTGPNYPTLGTSQTLLFGSVNSIVSVVSFAPILWNLSGPLSFFGVTVPKALFWIALVYVLFATVVAFWIGKPLIRLSFRNQATNAAFRYSLVRLRDAAEAVAFYRGEDGERGTLTSRFRAVIANYRAFVRRTLIFFGWNQTLSLTVSPLPLAIQAPRLFDNRISFGDVTQSASAFNAVHDSLSFFRSVYDSFASYRATIIRLDGLVEANERARELPTLTTIASTDGSVELAGVEVRSPTGRQLVDPLDMRLVPGDSLVIVGQSGAGKTTLLRSMAQLWPFATGTLTRPDGQWDAMFLSQLPYIPLGELRAVVSYPATQPFGDDRLRRVLEQVSLGHLGDRLGLDADWAKVLSPGEQQRVAFARVLLTRPRAVFLDESTSALDEGQEFALYRLLRSELPETIVVSVSHRSTVERHHARQLELLGGGPWRLTEV
jgi:putative ATP-binding cassette transporter